MKKITFLLVLFTAFSYAQFDRATGYISVGGTTAELNASAIARTIGVLVLDTDLGYLVTWNGSAFEKLGESVGGDLSGFDINTLIKLNTVANANLFDGPHSDISGIATDIAALEAEQTAQDAAIANKADDVDVLKQGLTTLTENLAFVKTGGGEFFMNNGQSGFEYGSGLGVSVYAPSGVDAGDGIVSLISEDGTGTSQLNVLPGGINKTVNGNVKTEIHNALGEIAKTFIVDSIYNNDADVPTKFDVDNSIATAISGLGSEITASSTDTFSNKSIDADNNTITNIGSSEIEDGSIANIDLASGAVTSVKILDGTITNVDIALESIHGTRILDGSISNSDLASGISLNKLNPTGSTEGQVIKSVSGVAVWANDSATAIGTKVADYTALAAISSPSTGDLAIVTNSGIAGNFVYDATLSATDNGGTIINGWVRQYSGLMNIVWFNAEGDGTTDDYAAIMAAHAALPTNGGTIFFPSGTYLHDSNITFTKKVTLIGEAVGNSAAESSTVLLKGAGVTGDGVSLTALGSTVSGIAFAGESGNTGDGLVLKSGRIALKDVAAYTMGGDGVRIGTDAGNENTNLWFIENIKSKSNGGSGLTISEGSGGGADANGGTLIHADLQSNGSHGLEVGNAQLNTFNGVVAQSNGADGVHLSTDANKNTFIGGDYEGNVSGNEINVVTGADRNVFIGGTLGAGVILDNGTDTSILGMSGTQITSSKTNDLDVNGDLVATTLSGNGEGITGIGLLSPQLIANGDFSTGDSTGWSRTGEDGSHILTWTGGVLRFQSDTTSPQLLVYQNSTLEVGKYYSITVETTISTSGQLKTDSFGTSDVISNGVGTITIKGYAISTQFNITRNGTNVDVSIDSVLVKEIIPFDEFHLENGVNVAWYGADGVGNDSAAFAAAFAASNNVYVPEGTFMASFDMASNQRLIGQGRENITTLIPATGATYVIRSDASTVAKEHIYISDIEFENPNSETNCVGILFNGVDYLDQNDFHVVERVYTSGFDRGIEVLGRQIWSTYRDVEVTGNRIGYNADVDPANTGFNLNNFHNFRASGNSEEGFKIVGLNVSNAIYSSNIEGNNTSATAGMAGIHIEDSKNFSIQNSYIELNGANVAVDNSTITNNAYGILFAGTNNDNPKIDNNFIDGSGVLVGITSKIYGGEMTNNYLQVKTGGYELYVPSSYSPITNPPFKYGAANRRSNGGVLEIVQNGDGNYAAYVEQANATVYIPLVRNWNLRHNKKVIVVPNGTTYTGVAAIEDMYPGMELTIFNNSASNSFTIDSGLIYKGSGVISPETSKTYMVIGYPDEGKFIEVN